MSDEVNFINHQRSDSRNQNDQRSYLRACQSIVEHASDIPAEKLYHEPDDGVNDGVRECYRALSAYGI